MPQFKVLKTIERVNPKTKVFEQIVAGTVLDELTDAEFRAYKRAGAVQIIQDQATQAPDVSAVLDAAAAAPAPKGKAKDNEVS